MIASSLLASGLPGFPRWQPKKRHAVLVLIMLTLLEMHCDTEPKKTNCRLLSMDETEALTNDRISTTFVYSDNRIVARIIVVNDGNGPGNELRRYTYDTSGKIIQAGAFIYTYDKNNAVIRRYRENPLDDGRYEYNSHRQVTTYTHTTWLPFSSNNYREVTQYEYLNNVTHNPLTATITNSHTTEFEYDNSPNPESGLFPSIEPTNNITKITLVNANPPAVETYSYKYSSNGYPISRTSSNGGVRNYTYDCN